MEFYDRRPEHPGRVCITPVNIDNGIFDITLEDGAGENYAGTPLNAQTFKDFRQEIYNYISANSGMRGPKGDNGEKGVSISNKTFLVGTDDASGVGWYKLGSVNIGADSVYSAKILITNTGYETTAPSGVLEIKARRSVSRWESYTVEWNTLTGKNKKYICYYFSPGGELVLYAYIPEQYSFYRIDVLCESNRNTFGELFQPVVNYGGVSQTKYSTGVPISTGYPETKEEIKFFPWVYNGECASDKIVTCTKTTHGINTVQGAVLVPKSVATATSQLDWYENITVGNTRYGITISNSTVYVAFDDGTLKHGFYCLIYGV